MRRFIHATVLLTALLLPCPARSMGPCCFGALPSPTIREEAGNARMVLIGRIRTENDKETNTNLELEIAEVLHSDPFLAGRMVLPLPFRVEVNPKKPLRVLFFCDVLQGEIDFYRGIPIETDAGLEYVKKVLALNPKDRVGNLVFFSKYLEHSDKTIAEDAFLELSKADYKDYREMAKSLLPDKIAARLEDKNTPSSHCGLYAMLLGHCGKAEHAEMLRKKLNDKDNPVKAGRDDVVAAYTMLRPKDGYAYIQETVRDPTSDFAVRYGALKALRFMWEYRTDLITQKDIAECVVHMIDQEDIGDLAIDDLRKWGCWDCADKILALKQSAAYRSTPMIRRAVLRYALRCKDNPTIEEFLIQERLDDPDRVKNAEDLLALTEPVIQPAPGNQPENKK